MQVIGQTKNLRKVDLYNSVAETHNKKNLFLINLTTGLAQKAEIRRTNGEYEVKSVLQPFWELGISL